MKKYYPTISFLLLVSFISIAAIAQTRNYRFYRVDVDNQSQREIFRSPRNITLRTICNSSWLAEATGADVVAEVSNDSDINWFFTYNLGDFIVSNRPCDSETGDTPLLLAIAAEADPSVIKAFRDIGADPYVANHGEITPADLLEDIPDPETARNNRIYRLHKLGEQAGCPHPRELVFERNGTISCR